MAKKEKLIQLVGAIASFGPVSKIPVDAKITNKEADKFIADLKENKIIFSLEKREIK